MTPSLVAIDDVCSLVQPTALDAQLRLTMQVFFSAEIGNSNTRDAYIRAARDFFQHVANNRLASSLEAITPLHVQSWLDGMTERRLAVPTIKLRLAALRMLFNALVRAQILSINPVAVVKGPKHRISKGKTPVLAGDETRHLLQSIDTSTLVGLRDRAIIATMAYTFARIGAVAALQCRHIFRQGGRLWLRLSEKGGKCLDVPCHPNLEAYLLGWLQAAGHGDEPHAPLFQSLKWEEAVEPGGASRIRFLSGSALKPAMAWEMVQRRVKGAKLETHVTNHTFRATGITAYLKNGGTIERAAHIAGHSSTRTTQLYDRRSDDVTIDEIERIRFGS
jgi:integrase